MITFYEWVIREGTSNIAVDMSEYDKSIKAAIRSLEEYSRDQSEKLSQFQFNPQIISQSSYPNKDALLNSLNNFDPENDDELDNHMSSLTNWYLSSTRGKSSLELRNMWKHVLDQHSKLKGFGQYNPEDYVNLYNDLMEKSNAFGEQMKNQIAQTIQSIPNWFNSPVRIVPQTSYESNNATALEPASHVEIYVGSLPAMFSYYVEDNKPIVDEIIEGGEEDADFFDNDKVKADYYSLINEIRKPGSNSKGKTLTLYTARPQKDREFYTSTKWLPINLFLTNSANHAAGLAHDLGNDEVRDIWKVRIDSKYLVQTLDGPIQYYMVSQDKAPIISMNLY